MIQNNRYSNHKIVWFPEKLESLRVGETQAPIYLRIKPTNRCNHSCYFCVYNYDFSKMHDSMSKVDEISRDKMFEILDDVNSIGVKAITYSGGGEPLVHRHISDIICKTLALKIDLSMLTNGELLKDKVAEELIHAKWIRISMDYTTPEMFEKTRKGSTQRFYKILDNIKKFNASIEKYKTGCELGINFIITKDNYFDLYDIADLLIDHGVNNIRFSPLWVPNFYEYHEPIKNAVMDQLAKAKIKFNVKQNVIYDSYKIVPDVLDRQYSKCHFMQITPVIGADLNVYNCHNKAYDQDGIIGSIEDRKFSEMWFSQETRDHFDKFRPDVFCKHQCANDQKNLFIHELINCYGDNYV